MLFKQRSFVDKSKGNEQNCHDPKLIIKILCFAPLPLVGSGAGLGQQRPLALFQSVAESSEESISSQAGGGDRSGSTIQATSRGQLFSSYHAFVVGHNF